MKQLFRKVLALLLALICILPMPALALAENYRYPANQYFEVDTSLTKGVTVQVSAPRDRAGAEKRRNQMLEKGYDCFIYHEGDHYRVMCGKFRGTETAKHYLDHICSHTDRSSSYLTNVYLPEWAYEEFEEIYETDPFNTQGQPYTAWEQPSGPFYDGDSAGSTKRVYTVQVSSGTNFTRHEEHRDALIAVGFDAFVYKRNGNYKTMSGMFDRSSDAEARCEAIRTYTAETDAYVTQVDIPTSYARIQSPKNQAAYYAEYEKLLKDFKWAKDYLPDGRAATLIDASYEGDQQMYAYFVSDLDGNGVDDLIILDALESANGAWAIFSCDDRGRSYLISWGYPYGVPVLLACQSKGLLAMQSYYAGMGCCELLELSKGKLVSSKRSTAMDKNYVRVYPTDVDANAEGYYVELTPFSVTDLSRLNGEGVTVTVRETTAEGGSRQSSSGGYTSAGIRSAARDAADRSTHYSLKSDKDVELQIPNDSELLSRPFQMRTYAAKGKAIYIMPKPQANNGVLGTVAHKELVTVVAETDDFYFFVTQDGRAGWNGKSRFTQP